MIEALKLCVPNKIVSYEKKEKEKIKQKEKKVENSSLLCFSKKHTEHFVTCH